MRDGCRTVMLRAGITPRIITNNTPVVSFTVDRLGWEWIVAVIVTGTLADANATFDTLLEESADSGMAGATAVADVNMVSQTEGMAPELAASFSFSSDNQVRKIEVLPNAATLRYLRLTITPAGNTGNAFLGQAWMLGAPNQGTIVQLAA